MKISPKSRCMDRKNTNIFDNNKPWDVCSRQLVAKPRQHQLEQIIELKNESRAMKQQKSKYLRRISTWNTVSDFKCKYCVLGSKIINMVFVHLLRTVQMQGKDDQTDIDFRFLLYGEKLLCYQEFVGKATDSGLNWATK